VKRPPSGLDSVPLGRQTLVMVDIRNADAMVAALCDARRRFEKGGPVPCAAAALLRDVADAFADSGPLDLGLTSESWVEAIASVDRGMASLAEDSSSKTTLEVKRSLKELQSCFARNEARQELL